MTTTSGFRLNLRGGSVSNVNTACDFFEKLGSVSWAPSDITLITDRAGIDAARRYVGAPENRERWGHCEIFLWARENAAAMIAEWAPLAPMLYTLGLVANPPKPSEYTAFVRAKTLDKTGSLEIILRSRSAVFSVIVQGVKALFAFTAGELTSASLGRFLARDGDDAVKRTLKSFLVPRFVYDS